MIDFTAACARGARETKQIKDAGRRPWWYQGRARGRRDAQVFAWHPRARGRGISHLTALARHHAQVLGVDPHRAVVGLVVALRKLGQLAQELAHLLLRKLLHVARTRLAEEQRHVLGRLELPAERRALELDRARELAQAVAHDVLLTPQEWGRDVLRHDRPV